MFLPEEPPECVSANSLLQLDLVWKIDDPTGAIAANLPIERVIATIVYPAAEIIRPGVIKHIEGNRFSLAEIDNSETPRIKLVSETLKKAGLFALARSSPARRSARQTSAKGRKRTSARTP